MICSPKKKNKNFLYDRPPSRFIPIVFEIFGFFRRSASRSVSVCPRQAGNSFERGNPEKQKHEFSNQTGIERTTDFLPNLVFPFRQKAVSACSYKLNPRRPAEVREFSVFGWSGLKPEDIFQDIRADLTSPSLLCLGKNRFAGLSLFLFPLI